MTDAVEHDVIHIDLRVVHVCQNFLEAFVQVFRHQWPAVGLADHQSVVHIAVLTEIIFELSLELLQGFQLVYYCFRKIGRADAALSLGLLQHNNGSGAHHQVREGVDNINL